MLLQHEAAGAVQRGKAQAVQQTQVFRTAQVGAQGPVPGRSQRPVFKPEGKGHLAIGPRQGILVRPFRLDQLRGPWRLPAHHPAQRGHGQHQGIRQARRHGLAAREGIGHPNQAIFPHPDTP